MLVTPINNTIGYNKIGVSSQNKAKVSKTSAVKFYELPKVQIYNNISFKGAEELLDAAEGGDLNVVEEELAAGTSVNVRGSDKQTPLIRAILNDHNDIALRLLDEPKIKVNLKDEDYDSALILAIEKDGMEDIVKKLLEHPDINVNIKDCGGNTPLIRACQFDDDETVKMILERPDVKINMRDDDNWTALDYADHNINIKIQRMILDYKQNHPANIIKPKEMPVDIEKMSPEENIWTTEEISKKFLSLVNKRDYTKAQQMLETTPHIDLNGDNNAILKAICSSGNIKTAEAVFDYKFHKQKSMLEEYEQRRKVFMEETIKNLSYDELKNNNVALNTLEGFKILMSKPEFNPNGSYETMTLFERACILDSEGNLAKSILAKYDDVFVNNAKKTKNEVIKSLIENYEKEGKFKVKLENIKSKLSNAQTREAAVESLNDFVSSDGFKPEMTDSVGNDVLHIIAGVASDGSREIIQKVLDKGGQVDSLNIGKQTPIMSAIKGLMIAKTEDEKSGVLSNIKFLLDKGADVDAKDLNDQTVFHYVCRTLSVALLVMFLTKSPNVFIRDKYGNRAAKYLQSEEMKDLYQKYIIG